MLQPERNPEDLLRRITNRIRQTLELPEILTTTVTEIRSLLGMDRVMIYRFHESGSGEVVAESIQDNRLPSLQGLNFPADDIPEQARYLYLKVRLRSIVDVASGLIGLSPLAASGTDASVREAVASIQASSTTTLEEVHYRPLDPCHAAYLTAMGVQSSMVMPIVNYNLKAKPRDGDTLASSRALEQLWGLLVAHHTQPHTISKQELQIVQGVVDQVSIAIAQATLLSQARQWHTTEATINWVSTLLHSLPTIELQAALEETVTALKGCGGRLYIAPYKTNKADKLFVYGVQPLPLEGNNASLIEQHPVWQRWASFKYEEKTSPQSVNGESLIVTDLYKTPAFRVLTPAFQGTPIRGLLVLPLYYRSSFLGYLSIFRSEIDTETVWAGRFDPSEKQRLPRQSFEAWRELKRGQAPEWTMSDVELAIALAHHFSMAIQQYELYSEVQSLNNTLEQQVEERTAKLQRALEQGQAVVRVTNQIRSTLNLKTTLQTIVREVRNLIDTDRVVIYQFTSDSQGEVIVEAINGDWLSALGVSIPQEDFLGRQLQLYQRGKARIINDVSQVKFSPRHQRLLAHFQIQAALIIPIGVSDQLWGLLIAQECKSSRHWQGSEIELLQQLADQAAVAIQQAELYEQSHTAAATATAQAQQLSTTAKQQEAL